MIVITLPEGAVANSQYRLIAKTLACRDTQKSEPGAVATGFMIGEITIQ